MPADSRSVFEDLLKRFNGPMSDVLQPSLFALKVSELTRGGFGASSMPEGSRASERPIPVSQPVAERDTDGFPLRYGQIGPADPYDRVLQRAVREHHRLLTEMLRLADRAFILERGILDKAEAVPDIESWPCMNARCDNLHERKQSQCDRCRQWKRRHGLEFPLTREETA